MIFNTPPNLVQLLDDVVGAAAGTAFYRSVLSGRPRIHSMEDFAALPTTPIDVFRAQVLADVVTDPARVEWIAGRYGGQGRRRVAVAEGVDETGSRYEVFRDSLREAAPPGRLKSAAVLTAPDRRYFAAEVSTILGYLGIPAHVFIDDGSQKPYKRIRQVRPDLLVLVSDAIDEAALPSSLKLALTFRRSHELKQVQQLDLYLVDEFGILAHSKDLTRWVVYNDQYLFEVSQDHRLVVTALRNHTQPLLRLVTDDTVLDLKEHDVALGELSERGGSPR